MKAPFLLKSLTFFGPSFSLPRVWVFVPRPMTDVPFSTDPAEVIPRSLSCRWPSESLRGFALLLALESSATPPLPG